MSVRELPSHALARLEDEPTVLALMRDFYAEEHLVFDDLVARRALHALLSNPELGLVLLLSHAGNAIGYLAITFGFSLEFHGRYALLDEVYLIAAVRGRGWGKYALQLAARIAREHDVVALRLEINDTNTRARSLYLKAGFQDDRRHLFTRWLT